jgi:hypothetical protein
MQLVLVAGAPHTGVGLVADWLARSAAVRVLDALPPDAGAVRAQLVSGDGDDTAVAAAVLETDAAAPALKRLAADLGDGLRVVYTIRNPVPTVTGMLAAAGEEVSKHTIEAAANRYRAGVDVDDGGLDPQSYLLVDYDRLHDPHYRDTIKARAEAWCSLDLDHPIPYFRAAAGEPLGPRNRFLVHRFVAKDGWARYEALRAMAHAQYTGEDLSLDSATAAARSWLGDRPLMEDASTRE